MASLKTLIGNAVQYGAEAIKSLASLADYCKTNKVKPEAMRPIVLDAVSLKYKVAIVKMDNGKDKLDSNAAQYEAARKCMLRTMTAAWGKKPVVSHNTDPVARVVKSAGKLTKAQVRRIIAGLEALL